MNGVRWGSLHAGLRRFIGARIRDHALADDLTQETLVRLHQNLDRIEDSERVLGYAFRIARSVIADHYRGRADPAVAGDDGLREIPAADPMADDEPGVRAARAVLGHWLDAQIELLPDRYREVIARVEREGHSQRDVALALGLPYSTVKSRAQRGRALLHAELLACCRLQLDGRGRVTDFEARPAACDCQPRDCATACAPDDPDGPPG